MQAVVNEDAEGTKAVLQAEVHRLKMEIAALQKQGQAGLAPALAASAAFIDPPNSAAVETAQVCTRSACLNRL